MKNKQINVWSFTVVKLQAKRRSLLAIIALVAVIGFSMTACNSGGTGDNDPEWTVITDVGSLFKGTHLSAYSIAYSNGKFIIVGDKMATSTDGETWTVASNPLDPQPAHCIAYGNNKWVAGGLGGKMATSTDNGETWTAVTNSTFEFGAANKYINAIAFGNGKFVAVGDKGKMATFTDGETWTAVTNSTFDDSDINAIAYGNNKWVAGGKIGKMATSTDGATWTGVDSTFGDNGIKAIAYGNGKWIAVGENGKMATSTDGETWTAVNTESKLWSLGTMDAEGNITKGFVDISAIAFGNGNWVAVSTAGYSAKSTDNGATWTKVKYANYYHAIAYGNGKFVAVGHDISYLSDELIK